MRREFSGVYRPAGWGQWGRTALRRVQRGGVAGLLAWALAGCGGGGGGDDFSVSFSTRSITLAAVQGQGGNSAVITAQASGSTDDGVYVGAEVSGTGTGLRLPVAVDIAGTTATITVQPDSFAPAGTYQGTLTLMACKDVNCNSHHKGSPHAVSYTVSVAPPLSVGTSSVSLAVAEGATGAAQVLTATLPAGVTPTTRTTYNQTASDWLQVSVQGSELRLTPVATHLRAGTYSAQVQVQVSQPVPQSLSLPVLLNVSSGLVLPEGVATTLQADTTMAALRGSATVQAASGLSLPDWSASTEATWLVLDRGRGAVGEALTWQPKPEALAAMAYGEQLQAVIRVTAGDSVSPRDLTVTLTNFLPRLDSVDLLALPAGQGGEVLVWGRGLAALAASPASFLVDGGQVSPSAVTRLGAGLMALQLPALSAGAHQVTVTNAAGIAMPARTLQVLAPVERPYQSVAVAGQPRSPLWDAVSQTLWYRTIDTGAVARVDLSGTTPRWTSRGIAGIHNIGLTRAHDALLVATTDGGLSRLDPATLATRSSRMAGAANDVDFVSLPLAITGDDLLWLRSGTGWSHLLTHDLTSGATLADRGSTAEYSFYGGPWGAVSGNGRYLLMAQSGGISPAPVMLRRDAAGGADAAASDLLPLGQNVETRFFYRASVDRQGTRWALDNFRVFDFDLNRIGDLVLPGGWIALATAVSPDGSRTYVYSVADNAIGTYHEPAEEGPLPRVHVFDSSSAMGAVASLPLLGSFDLADYSGCRVTQGSQVCYPYDIHMVMTDDSRSLLVVGDRRVVVTPVPAGMLRAASLGQGPRRSVQSVRTPPMVVWQQPGGSR